MRTSPALEQLKKKRCDALENLEALLDDYHELSDDARLEKSTEIFDDIRFCLTTDENLIYPMLPERLQKAEIIYSSQRLHQRILDVLEHATMMHVDEPQEDYKNILTTLYRLFRDEADRALLSTYPLARKALGEDDMESLSEALHKQHRKESSVA